MQTQLILLMVLQFCRYETVQVGGTVKIQISLCVCSIQSESLFSAILVTNIVSIKDSDQTAWIHRLI